MSRERYSRHPEFEVTVPFKQELHQASDSAIPSPLLPPHSLNLSFSFLLN